MVTIDVQIKYKYLSFYVCINRVYYYSQLLNVPMLAAWALFYFATNITQIYVALGEFLNLNLNGLVKH